tara:strand:+ start:33330 stop:34451 length:1122 start_codon:yes stop_codon:yes gene_type:complete
MELATQKTVLYDTHISLGARIVSFSGFLMPLHYSGIIEEHNSVRNSVGLFDLSHMGEFYISGKDSFPFLQRITTNDLSKINVGQAQYSAFCNKLGGIIDDFLIYRFTDHFLIVVNASNIVKDFMWLKENVNVNEDISIEDQSNTFSLLSIQGPLSLDLLLSLVKNSEEIESLPYYHYCHTNIGGVDIICSRTGYTGELGYELYIKGSGVKSIWNIIMDKGADLNIQAIGLGARDTLRLEMKYCLYGNDISENNNPLEARLGWITKFGKGDFIGKEKLIQFKSEGIKRKLIGFEISGKGIARNGYKLIKNGTVVGHVTSGSYSPSLLTSIGMAYVKSDYTKIGENLIIDARGRELQATIVNTPFWTKGTALDQF